MLERPLDNTIQISLRESNQISSNEVAIQIGDLFVAENIIDKSRRQLDTGSISSLLTKVSEGISESSNRTLLKG